MQKASKVFNADLGALHRQLDDLSQKLEQIPEATLEQIDEARRAFEEAATSDSIEQKKDVIYDLELENQTILKSRVDEDDESPLGSTSRKNSDIARLNRTIGDADAQIAKERAELIASDTAFAERQQLDVRVYSLNADADAEAREGMPGVIALRAQRDAAQAVLEAFDAAHTADTIPELKSTWDDLEKNRSNYLTLSARVDKLYQDVRTAANTFPAGENIFDPRNTRGIVFKSNPRFRDPSFVPREGDPSFTEQVATEEALVENIKSQNETYQTQKTELTERIGVLSGEISANYGLRGNPVRRTELKGLQAQVSELDSLHSDTTDEEFAEYTSNKTGLTTRISDLNTEIANNYRKPGNPVRRTELKGLNVELKTLEASAPQPPAYNLNDELDHLDFLKSQLSAANREFVETSSLGNHKFPGFQEADFRLESVDIPEKNRSRNWKTGDARRTKTFVNAHTYVTEAYANLRRMAARGDTFSFEVYVETLRRAVSGYTALIGTPNQPVETSEEIGGVSTKLETLINKNRTRLTRASDLHEAATNADARTFANARLALEDMWENTSMTAEVENYIKLEYDFLLRSGQEKYEALVAQRKKDSRNHRIGYVAAGAIGALALAVAVFGGGDGARGPAGPQGESGAPGQPGAAGAAGVAGAPGTPGTPGQPGAAAGSAGEQGLTGDAGKDGLAGKDGVDGTFDPTNPDHINALNSAVATYLAEQGLTLTGPAGVELNYNIPVSLYTAATDAARTNLTDALQPYATASGIDNDQDHPNGVTELETLLARATDVDFNDTNNQVRLYDGPDLLATIGVDDEEAFDGLVALKVLTGFDTVPYIDRADYASILTDDESASKLGESLVGITIRDRTGFSTTFETGEEAVSFLRDSAGKYGPAQVGFGRDGKIRLTYEGSADRIPFHTLETDLLEEKRVLDTMLE